MKGVKPQNTKFCKHPDVYPCIYCMLAQLKAKQKDWTKIAYGFYQTQKKSYSRHGCDRCGGIDEPYMLRDDIWKIAAINNENYLCLNCVKLRVGALKLNYFRDVPINFGSMLFDVRAYLRHHK